MSVSVDIENNNIGAFNKINHLLQSLVNAGNYLRWRRQNTN